MSCLEAESFELIEWLNASCIFYCTAQVFLMP